jgi:hypothetical protein
MFDYSTSGRLAFSQFKIFYSMLPWCLKTKKPVEHITVMTEDMQRTAKTAPFAWYSPVDLRGSSNP